LAEHILETKVGHFDPAEFQDRYENAAVEMLKHAEADRSRSRTQRVRAISTSGVSQ
jgi:non-homologous end joining protein Ku